ncbi:MAG TPA: lipopolysaccharide kinase InaA family protein [Candidatus Binataceae bacterium]|nr:lipopolysaccharide kinase InaA family protein [Candidatus Binataceae bacterium]
MKDEGRTRACLVPGPDGTPVFVKRVRTGSWLGGLAAMARGSRVRRWLAGAAMLEAAGFNHPTPLAALEVRRAGAVTECYLACTALSRATILSRAVFGDGSVDLRRRRALLGAVAHEVRRLHDAGLYTHDLQETNLMVEAGAGAAPRIWFVDLEDFRHARTVSWHRRLTNLIHLDRSLGRFLSRGTRMRFLRDYVEGMAPGRNERRRLVAEFLRMRARVEKRRRLQSPRRPTLDDAAAVPAPSPRRAGAGGPVELAPRAGD